MKTLNTTKLNSLERQVYGNNLIKELTIKNLKEVLPVLRSFVGKKIVLADNSLSKALKSGLSYYDHKFNPIDGSKFRTYLTITNSSGHLILNQDVTIKDTEYPGGGYGVTYYEKSLYIGSLSSGILSSLDDLEVITQSYSLDKKDSYKAILAKKNKIEKLKDELSKLKSEVSSYNI